MTKTTGTYRDKYLELLREQEQAEKQFRAQLDYLRKTLLNLGAAAAGLDTQLDAEIAVLKDTLRGGSGAQAIEQMERVHLAVGNFERSRERECEQALNKFKRQISHLLALQIPSDVANKLKQYQKELDKKLGDYRSYPQLVSELSVLQKLALDAASEPPQSFWQRLKGGVRLKTPELNKPEGPETEQADSSSSTLALTTNDVQLSINEPEGARETPLAAAIAEISEQDSLISEDDYQKVAKRINQTLHDLVEKIEPNDVVRHKVDTVRRRIERGLDWYALAVTLEDLRDILMQRYLVVDKEFGEYLERVNSELEAIGSALGVAIDTCEQKDQAAAVLSSAVSKEVAHMRTQMGEVSGLDQLKQTVNNHIIAIQRALDGFEGQQDNESVSLSDQLKALVERVQKVESESQKTRSQLAEERHKATHDSLTGLPNREAYNQRAYEETQRYKRYGHPLTLAVCDVDHFKKINDNYGHQSGDKVLKLISKVLSSRLRQVDFVARYGGEEFVILLPETTEEQAATVLDKIRSGIASTPFRFKDEPVNITISFGIAAFAKDDNVEDVFERADKALYQAKRAGRNRCEIAA